MLSRLGASVAVRVARVLYSRWERLGPAEREQLGPLADELKERALELRGSADREDAARHLGEASRNLAEALGDSAAADPDVAPDEVAALRADLRRELERVERQGGADRAA